MEPPLEQMLAGGDLSSPLDAVFVNAPLRDYSLRERVNNVTLPVLGMGYIASYAARQHEAPGLFQLLRPPAPHATLDSKPPLHAANHQDRNGTQVRLVIPQRSFR